LYERITTIAKTRAPITDATIHLFLVILRDMVVKTFLLLSIASSTPWSCNTGKYASTNNHHNFYNCTC